MNFEDGWLKRQISATKKEIKTWSTTKRKVMFLDERERDKELKMTKLEKLAIKINSKFGKNISDAVREKYGIEVDNMFDVFSMRLTIYRVDGEQITTEQMEWIDAFSKGYGIALSMVLLEE